jgi:hypothetical protein
LAGRCLCRCSSVVERTLGKGEVESSTLSSGFLLGTNAVGCVVAWFDRTEWRALDEGRFGPLS